VADVDDATRAVQEYLDTLDDVAFGAATTTKPKFNAHADPPANRLQRAKVQLSLRIPPIT